MPVHIYTSTMVSPSSTPELSSPLLTVHNQHMSQEPHLPYPDEALPAEQISLPTFLQRAEHLLALALKNNDLHPFVEFVLAGRCRQPDGSITRIFLNPRQGIPSPLGPDLQVTRDIDTVIGFSTNLPFCTAMELFPVASFRDTLTEPIHLKRKVKNSVSDGFVSHNAFVLSCSSSLSRCIKSQIWL